MYRNRSYFGFSFGLIVPIMLVPNQSYADGHSGNEALVLLIALAILSITTIIALLMGIYSLFSDHRKRRPHKLSIGFNSASLLLSYVTAPLFNNWRDADLGFVVPLWVSLFLLGSVSFYKIARKP